jgi:rhamnose transport system permease protein
VSAELDTAPTRDGVRRRGAGRDAVRVSSPIAFLAALVLIFSVSTDHFFELGNFRSIVITGAILVIASLAQMMVVITRNLDLSIGAVMASGMYLPLLLCAHHPGAGPYVLPLGIAVGAVLGAFNGVVVAYFGIPSLVATLGTLSIFRGIIYASADGRQISVHELPDWLPSFVDWRPAGIPSLGLVALVVIALAAVLLRRTSLGREMYAVGSNRTAAEFYGLPAKRIVLYVYAIAGGMAGLAGVLLAGQIGTVTVDVANGWELQTLAAVVIGGASLLGGTGGVLAGTVGALVIATIDNGLVQLGISGYWQNFVQGTAIVAAVGFDVVARRRRRRRLGTTGGVT